MNFMKTFRPSSPSVVTRRAFTLVEVLVVVAIIGIASAVVVPAMLQNSTMAIQAAGRIVIADLVWAQNDAIAMQKSRKLIFDAANNKYQITDAAGNPVNVPGVSNATYEVNFNTDKRFSGVFLGQSDFSGTASIEFNELGSPNTGGWVDLIAQGTQYRVSVAEVTGRVTIAPAP